jgi:hypothetical protein
VGHDLRLVVDEHHLVGGAGALVVGDHHGERPGGTGAAVADGVWPRERMLWCVPWRSGWKPVMASRR